MNYGTIHSLLNAHLQTVVGLPALQLENTTNSARVSSFSRATLIPARPSAATLGITGMEQRQGLYQVDLFMPSSVGTDAANTLADAVIAVFSRGSTLYEATPTTALRIDSSWREGAQIIDKFYVVPVVVQWSTFAP